MILLFAWDRSVCKVSSSFVSIVAMLELTQFLAEQEAEEGSAGSLRFRDESSSAEKPT